MTLFMVEPETLWPHDRAGLLAVAAARKRDSRTVKQATCLLNGADTSGALRRPFLHGVPGRLVTGAQPVPGSAALRAATQGKRGSRPDAERSPVFLPVRKDTGSNVPVSYADPRRGRAALSSVRPGTRWPRDHAEVTAKASTRERNYLTVKQVTFLLHGATRNGAPRRPFLHRVPRRPVTGVQPVPGSAALRAATRAMPSSRPGAGHGPTYAAMPHRGTGCVTPRLWGVTQPAAQATTRTFTAIRR